MRTYKEALKFFIHVIDQRRSHCGTHHELFYNKGLERAAELFLQYYIELEEEGKDDMGKYIDELFTKWGEWK